MLQKIWYITKLKALFLYAKIFDAAFSLIQETYSVDEDYSFGNHSGFKSSGWCTLQKIKTKLLVDPCGHHIFMVSYSQNNI